MREQRISFLLNDLVREMNSKADGIVRREYDITYSQFVFLLVVGENDDLDVTRLALALGVTKGAVSKRVDWFIDRGLVETTQKPGKEKGLYFSLTKKGADLAKSAGDFLEQSFIKTISMDKSFNEVLLRGEVHKMLQVLTAKRDT